MYEIFTCAIVLPIFLIPLVLHGSTVMWVKQISILDSEIYDLLSVSLFQLLIFVSPTGADSFCQMCFHALSTKSWVMLGSEIRGKERDTNGKSKLPCSWWLTSRYSFNEERGEHRYCKNICKRGFFFMINSSWFLLLLSLPEQSCIEQWAMPKLAEVMSLIMD